MTPKVSVIMPMDRPGEDSRRAIDSILAQKTTIPFELLVVAGGPIELGGDPRVRLIAIEDRNPAVRRNRAASVASGDYLAFIDDDAFAEEEWVETAAAWLAAHPEVVAVGGPDPAPTDSSIAELIADTLLAARFIGSGVACHQNRPGVFGVRDPHDLALVNLFVRRSAFERAGGFDETIGYIGEDTALLAKLMELGTVVHHGRLIVRHRRRRFPGPYLAQRWRYRFKTGRMIATGNRSYAANPKIALFLLAAIAFIGIAITVPLWALLLLVLYAGATLLFGTPATRLPLRWWWVIPPAFLLHHATYFLGIVAGAVAGVIDSARSRFGSRAS
ncbi:MAG TPA: glycosyltransferase [Thermoanaerobaculia bacterium]|nr:glycosyltransferase [Thermoanaerobaculia bacterium]